MNGILFISSKCNLDLRQRLNGRFFNFYRVFSIKRRLKYAGLLFLLLLFFSVHLGNLFFDMPFEKLERSG
jgi:hypothetical protein